MLSYEEQQYLFKNINSKNRKKLIECNLKLVVFVAKRFFNRSYESLTPMDLIEAGNIGLIEAIEKFDYKKGYRFSTYASHYIKKEIIFLRYGFNNENPKKLEEIANVFGLTRQRIKQIEKKAFERIRDNKDLKNYLNY